MTIGMPFSFWGAGYLKSVQAGEIIIAANATSGTATIATVSTSNAFVILNGFRSANASAFDASMTLPALVLTNATTVTASTAVVDASNARTVSYCVVEFVPGILKSLQSGTTVVNGTSNPQTATSPINAVTTANSFIVNKGCTFAANSALISNIYQNVQLTNSTTVTGRVSNGTANNSTCFWTVVEFNPGYTTSIQQISTTVGTNATTATTTISSVNTANSLLIYGGIEIPLGIVGTTSDTTRYVYSALTNATTVTATRAAASATLNSAIYNTVVQFASPYPKSSQTGQTAIASGATQKSNTVSSVNVSKSVLTMSGFTASTNTGTNPAQTFPTVGLVSATNVQQDRGASAVNTVTQSWDVLEFK